MKNFRLVDEGLHVGGLLREVEANPQLWDRDSMRLMAGGPFEGTSDIWVRYRAPEELISPQSYSSPHFAVFWEPWQLLPAMHGIVWRLMQKVRATHLGGILLTRIPAGGRILPHHDKGSWHAEFYETKVYVPLKSNPQCVNHCEDESIAMRAGEAWWFDNLVTHSVDNFGDEERITLIVCMSTQ